MRTPEDTLRVRRVDSSTAGDGPVDSGLTSTDPAAQRPVTSRVRGIDSIEELSPGMCTVWGDLVRRQVTARDFLRAVPPVAHACATDRAGHDGPLTCALTTAELGPIPAEAPVVPPTVPTDLGTGRGQTGDRPWTARRPGAQPSRCPRVDNRKTPTPHSGQQGHSAADLHEGPRSPASTPVMTRMRELSREFLEPQSGWGSLRRAGSRASATASSTGVSRRQQQAR